MFINHEYMDDKYEIHKDMKYGTIMSMTMKPGLGEKYSYRNCKSYSIIYYKVIIIHELRMTFI